MRQLEKGIALKVRLVVWGLAGALTAELRGQEFRGEGSLCLVSLRARGYGLKQPLPNFSQADGLTPTSLIRLPYLVELIVGPR